MACAGYLVRNNTTIVYAEIVHGLLVCTEAAQHRANVAMDKAAELPRAEEAESVVSLPLLAPKRMERTASFVVDKLKLGVSEAAIAQPEDEPSDEGAAQADLPVQTFEAPRVVQLSGHVVEVVDCADEGERDGVVTLLPFSFRVNTKTMTLHADGSYSFTPADTLLLSAVDQTTKDEWLKRLARWNRYGWRETVLLAATEDDADLLELALQRWRDNEVSSILKPAALVFGYASASAATRSSSRRRFYRHTGSVSSGYAPVDTSCPDESAWFQMRVVKTHI